MYSFWRFVQNYLYIDLDVGSRHLLDCLIYVFVLSRIVLDFLKIGGLCVCM